jgi:Flp pilus assembly protein TadB
MFKDGELEKPASWTKQIEFLKAIVATASMSKSLETFVLPDGHGPCNPTLLQIALYVQGLAFSNSQSRRGGLRSLRNPEVVLRELAVTARKEYYFRLLGEKVQKLKELHFNDLKFKRRQELKYEQDVFLKTHSGMVKLGGWFWFLFWFWFCFGFYFVFVFVFVFVLFCFVLLCFALFCFI